MKPDERLTEGYRGVTVVLAAGAKISGVARDHTNYSVQGLDAKGNLHSIEMRKVKDLASFESAPTARLGWVKLPSLS